MKITKRILWILLMFLLVVAGATGYYLQTRKPQLSGTLTLDGLHQSVDVWFDNYGIPHIYAQTEEDAYLALGYVHAQDRLFQMDMIRRAASGRLSEVFGKDMLKVDQFFRTIGLNEFARTHARKFLHSDTASYQRAALAYLQGVNHFVKNGKTPVEYLITGMPKEEFTPTDIYLTIGFMSFGFAEGFRADPILEYIRSRWGEAYLSDLAVQTPAQALHIRNHRGTPLPAQSKLITAIHQALNALPVPLWQGSNAWVVSGQKSASGFPILANDTHIGFSQPAVWYEAHLEYPGFSFYGHHLAGIPFALLGNNRFCGVGLTMLENDDVDFFREKAHPDHPDEVWYIDHWEKLSVRTEIIRIKGMEDHPFTVRNSRHGPIINGIVEPTAYDTAPIALSWQLLLNDNLALQAAYQLNHAASFDEARSAVAQFSAPGLNVMYADVHGNIAWWAAARLPVRPTHVVSKLFLDGSSGHDEYQGFYPFEKNPHAVNPPWGYVYSANNQPEAVDGVLYPGYYYPRNRAARIVELLEARDRFSLADIQRMQLDITSADHRDLASMIGALLEQSPDADIQLLAGILRSWDGSHTTSLAAPTVFYALLSQIIFDAMADEIGEEALVSLAKTSVLKNSYAMLIGNARSPWWDNVQTSEVQEARGQILTQAARSVLEELRKNLGPQPDSWSWGKVHTLTHAHALGSVKPLNRIFNVGPFAVDGGSEVLNNLHFTLNTTGYFPVEGGPALRKVTDFADLDHGVTISPTGQSGNIMSPHYADQAAMFASGRVRPMLMNREEIFRVSKNHLRLLPVIP
jgi:penicillin amidase